MSTRPQGMVRVMIVEDDQATRQRFADAISSDPRTTLVQALGAGREAIAQLRAARHLPDCDAMVITVFGDERNVLASIEAGAAGYVLKDCSDADLIEHVLDLRAGGAPMSPGIARMVLNRMRVKQEPEDPRDEASADAEGRVTTREAEVLRLLDKR